MERSIVSFPGWKEVLAREAVSRAQVDAFAGAIFKFLRDCKQHRAGASVMRAKEYLTALPPQEGSGARLALRWWFQAGRQAQAFTGGSGAVGHGGDGALGVRDWSAVDRIIAAGVHHLDLERRPLKVYAVSVASLLIAMQTN